MLKLKPERPETVTGDVEITVPGKEETETFKGVFKYRTKSEYIAFEKGFYGKTDIDVVADMLCGWSGIEDDNGVQVVFSKENLEVFIEHYPTSSWEIRDAYVKALFESKVKN